MKATIEGRTDIQTRTHFKKGELVETGYGAVMLLLSDLQVGRTDGIHGVVLYSERNPSNIGRVADSYHTTSGVIKLFEGKLVLENEKVDS